MLTSVESPLMPLPMTAITRAGDGQPGEVRCRNSRVRGHPPSDDPRPDGSGALVEPLPEEPHGTAVVLDRGVLRAAVSDQRDDPLAPGTLGARVMPEREEPVDEGTAFVPT